MTEKEPQRFAPQPGQEIPVVNLDESPDNAMWLLHLHPDEPHAPDGPEWLEWALAHGYTVETWATSVKRAQWQSEWDERQAAKGGNA